MDEDQLREAFQNAKNLERVDENADRAIGAYSGFIDSCLRHFDKTGGESSPEMKKLLAQAYNNRGYLKYRRVDFDEAIEDYSKGLGHDETMHYSYYNRGLIHYRLARYDEAIADLEKSLKLKPDFDPAQKCLQQSLIDKERTTQDGAKS